MEKFFTAEALTGLALFVATIAAIIDFRTGHIPNWLTVGALGLGAGLHLALGAWSGGWLGLRSAAIVVIGGVALCSVVPLFLWRVARMGGGDLKLLAALGALCGPITGFRAQTYAFVVMFVYLLGRLAYEGKLFQVWFRVLSLLFWRLKSRRAALPAELLAPLRFGPAVMLGMSFAALADWKLV